MLVELIDVKFGLNINYRRLAKRNTEYDKKVRSLRNEVVLQVWFVGVIWRKLCAAAEFRDMSFSP